MAYLMLIQPCAACGVPVNCNPERVPSLINAHGERQALCRSCFARWNEIHRTSKGLAPEPLDPKAYQPLNESEP